MTATTAPIADIARGYQARQDMQDYFNEALEYAFPFFTDMHEAAEYAGHATMHAESYGFTTNGE